MQAAREITPTRRAPSSKGFWPLRPDPMPNGRPNIALRRTAAGGVRAAAGEPQSFDVVHWSRVMSMRRSAAMLVLFLTLGAGGSLDSRAAPSSRDATPGPTSSGGAGPVLRAADLPATE